MEKARTYPIHKGPSLKTKQASKHNAVIQGNEQSNGNKHTGLTQ